MQHFQRHTRYKRSDRKSQIRMIIGALFLLGTMALFWFNLKESQIEEESKLNPIIDFIPEVNQGVIYTKPNFSLSYVEKYEIPEWVAYRLTVDMMNKKKFPRNQDFNPDPSIREKSAHYHDYKNTGYRRGHLVPSADMSWDKESMDATFLLSNIAPMKESFNDGIWLELEHNVRDWSRKYISVIVVAGPAFTDAIKTIGNNDVLVPRYFYKAIFKVEGDKAEVIGFMFDQTNEDDRRLEQCIVPIDSIEKMTGLDLFSNLYGTWEEEIRLEKQALPTDGQWTFNEKWYNERTNEK